MYRLPKNVVSATLQKSNICHSYPLSVTPIPGSVVKCCGLHGGSSQALNENVGNSGPDGSGQGSTNGWNRKRGLMILAGAAAVGASIAAIWKSGQLDSTHGHDRMINFANIGLPKVTAGSLFWKTAAPAELPSHAQYLLIGAGTATFSAYTAIKAKDPKAKILIIGEEDYRPYSRPPLSKELWFGDPKDAAQLKFKRFDGKESSVFYETPESYTVPKDLNKKEGCTVALLTGKKVVEIDAPNQKAYLNDGNEITYDKCLIATGGKPKTLDIFQQAPEDVKKRTTLFRGIADFRKLEEVTKNVKTVAVVGGGFLGSELACAMAGKGRTTGLKVTQIFPGEGVLGRVLPDYLREWTTNKVRAGGVDILTRSNVTGVAYKSGQVELTLNSGARVLADHVVLSVGIEPNVDLANASGLEVDEVHGGIKVNPEMMARNNLWAAGDVASYYDIKLGRRRVEHHDHASVCGRVAGENMTGAGKPYLHQSMFWSGLGRDVNFMAVGRIDSTLNTVGVFPKGDARPVVVRTGPLQEAQWRGPPFLRMFQNPPTSPDDLKKGTIFYLKDGFVVGVVLWNNPRKLEEARKVVDGHVKENELREVSKAFN